MWPSSLLPPQVGHLLGQALASWPVCPQMVQVTVGVVLLAPELLLEGVLELLAGVLLLPEDAVLLDTSELDFEQSLDAMKQIIAQKIGG